MQMKRKKDPAAADDKRIIYIIPFSIDRFYGLNTSTACRINSI
jgi:hypothetical protein